MQCKPVFAGVLLTAALCCAAVAGLVVSIRNQHGDDASAGVRHYVNVLSSPTACARIPSSQLHGPLSEEQSDDLLRRILESAPGSATQCTLRNKLGRRHEPYVSWQPLGARPGTTVGGEEDENVNSFKWQQQQQQLREQACASHPDFCDSLYAEHETQHISKLIYDHQNPPDCSKANFLVLTREWHSGLGSNIHVKAWMLLVAIMSNRVLIDSPNIKWNMTNPANCPQQDWTCYFAPVSKCTLPQDWDEKSTPEFDTQDLSSSSSTTSRKYVRTIAHPQPLNGALVMGQSVNIQNFGGRAAFNSKPNSWWMTHATVYLIRPNTRTLDVACWFWSCMPGAHQNLGLSSQPTTSIFVRSGDKWKEAHLRTAQEHFDALEEFVRANPSLRPSSVYFGTDDALVFSDVARRYSDKYNLTWIGYHRETKGLTFEETITRAYSAKIEWQVLVSLSDLYISSLADIFVGTLSSNWCRLTDELRKVHGKAGLPYLTPQGEILVAAVVLLTLGRTLGRGLETSLPRLRVQLPAVDTGCNYLGATYTPSSLEKEWSENARVWAESYCEHTEAFKAQVGVWLESIATQKQSHAASAMDPSIFSSLQHTYDCDGINVTYDTYIEPLSHGLRHPQALCQNVSDAQLFNTSYLLYATAGETGPARGQQCWERTCLNILFNVGAGDVNELREAYRQRGIEIHRVLQWTEDASPNKVDRFNLSGIANNTSPSSPLHLIKDIVQPGDFVAFKLDIDDYRVEHTIVRDLLNDDMALELVDEFYYEDHVQFPPMLPHWGGSAHPHRALSDSYGFFEQLRRRGVRAHSWV